MNPAGEKNKECAVSNPVMTKNPYFQKTGVRPNQFRQQSSFAEQTQYQTDYTQQYASPSYQQQFGAQTASQNYQGWNQQQRQEQFNTQQGVFAAQSSAVFETMTYRDAMNKTAVLLGSTVLAGVLCVMLLGSSPSMMMGLAMLSTIAAFVVGMVIAFKRMVPAGLAVAYAILEGVALGGITGALNFMYPGVAMEAILGTVTVVAVTLGLHYSGKVRTTPKGMKFVLIVAFAGIVFGFVNMLISLFTGDNPLWNNPMLGIGLGIVMILVAAYMLINDFESVNDAVANGAPKEFAWTCGIGIVMTILWIYVEVLRIAAILADNR